MKLFNTDLSWSNLVGSEHDFTSSQRAFHGVSLVTLMALVMFFPVNLVIGLYAMAILLLVLIFMQFLFFYLSRFRNKFLTSVIFYAITSYATLVATYYLNEGINGPGVFLFFFTFHILIAFTPRRYHRVWVTIHILLPIALLFAEYYVPQSIGQVYDGQGERFLDIGTSYLVTLVFIYFIIIYLRNNQRRQRLQVEHDAMLINQQSVKLKEINEQKNKLFSIISHDLRSPLNSVKGYLELLDMGVLEEEEKKEMEQQLRHLTQHTTDMLTNLLSWSQSQLEGQAVSIDSVTLGQCLGELLTLQSDIAARKNIQLHNQLDGNILVKADCDMLQLVVRNLVNNAIKFTNPGKNIRVTSAVANGWCTLAVKDEGTGIPVDKQAQLFTLNVSSTVGTQQEKGVGLGLMLCKEYTELQHGKIWFESSHETGTTFYLSLPVAG